MLVCPFDHVADQAEGAQGKRVGIDFCLPGGPDLDDQRVDLASLDILVSAETEWSGVALVLAQQNAVEPDFTVIIDTDSDAGICLQS